jgi:hypothetical protein
VLAAELHVNFANNPKSQAFNPFEVARLASWLVYFHSSALLHCHIISDTHVTG